MQNGSQEYVNMKNYHEFHLGIRNPIPLNSKSNDLYDRVSVSKKQGCQVLKLEPNNKPFRFLCSKQPGNVWISRKHHSFPGSAFRKFVSKNDALNQSL